MLAKRLLVAVVLIPIAFLVVTLGGVLYDACVVGIMGLSAWEYARLFNSGGYQPAGVLLIGGTVLLVLGRAWNGFESSAPILALLLMASMAYHLIAFEGGRQLAGADFGITLSGALYVGWLGAYLISLRSLPQGEWWVLLALPSVWLVDTGAYFAGTRLGRHKLSPRLSPNKTWEGVAGGAQLRGADQLCLLDRLGRGRRPHDRRVALVGFKRPGVVSPARGPRSINLEAPNVTRPCAQAFAGDLAAHGAGDAVFRHLVGARVPARREMHKRFALASDQFGFVAHHRHVTDGALVLNGRRRAGMINCFAANARDPVGIAPRISHHASSPGDADRNILPHGRRKPVVAGDAAVRGLEMRAEGLGVRSILPADVLAR